MFRVEEREGVGRALVADEDIEAGTQIICEEPVLITPALHELTADRQEEYKSLASWLQADISWILHAHAFTFADDHTRAAILSEFCSWDDGADDLARQLASGILGEANRVCDPLSKHLSMPKEELRRALGVFCLNAHSIGRKGKRCGLYQDGSKLIHRCLGQHAVFRRQGAVATFRLVRSVQRSEIITTSYLGALSMRSTRIRRRHLMKTKLFECRCVACESADSFRLLPCPVCVTRRGGYLLEPETRTVNPEGWKSHPVISPLTAKAEAWQCDTCGSAFDSEAALQSQQQAGSIEALGKKYKTLGEAEQGIEDSVDWLDEQVADGTRREIDFAFSKLEEIVAVLGCRHWTSVCLRSHVLEKWLSTISECTSRSEAVRAMGDAGFCFRSDEDLLEEVFSEFTSLFHWYEGCGAQNVWGLVGEALDASMNLRPPKRLLERVWPIFEITLSRARLEFGSDDEVVLGIERDLESMAADIA